MTLLMELYPLAAEVSTCPTIDDKFNHIVAQGKLDYLYANIAMGVSPAELGGAMGMSERSMLLLLQRNPEAQNKYMVAKMSSVTMASIDTMATVSGVDEFEPSQTAAMNHHRQVVTMGMNAVEKLTNLLKPKGEVAPMIIVNNNTQFGGGDTPPVPQELRGVVVEHES